MEHQNVTGTRRPDLSRLSHMIGEIVQSADKVSRVYEFPQIDGRLPNAISRARHVRIELIGPDELLLRCAVGAYGRHFTLKLAVMLQHIADTFVRMPDAGTVRGLTAS